MSESSKYSAPKIEPVTVFKETFEKAGLSYTIGDMGPDSSGWPEAALLRPGSGLWLLDDSGMDSIDWRLLRFDWSGRRLFDCDLAAILKLTVGETVYPVAFQSAKSDGALLVISRKLFKKEWIQVLEVTGQCEPRGLRDLPSAPYYGKALITPAGDLWNREGHRPVEWTWRTYDTRGHQFAEVGAGAIVLVRDRVILSSPSGLRSFAPDGQSREVKMEVSAPLDGKLVGGAGAFFGAVRLTQGQFSGDESVPIESKRRLTVLHFDDKDLVVREVLRVTLAPEVFVESARMQFTHLFESQSWFDATGDFYEIAWHASSFEVRRYPLSALMSNK